MNLVIDEFNSLSNFNAFNGANLVTPENEINEFIAGLTNLKSTQFEFANEGAYVEKDNLNINVADYDYAVCHFYSSYNKLSQGKYTITFNDNNIFEIKLNKYLVDQYFSLKDIAVITKIKITYHGEGLDRLICSHCLAVKDELPYDIFEAIKASLEYDLNKLFGKGLLLGSISASAGQSEVSFKNIAYSALKYIDKYSVIEITEGDISERHVIEENDESFFKLGKLLDGKTIKNNFVDANVYLTVPVRHGIKHKEYNVPSISITGFDPDPILRGGKIERSVNTFEQDTAYSMLDEQIYVYTIQVAGIDRAESDIMALISSVIRTFIAREILWLNGQKYDIFFDGKPEFIELAEAANPITGLVYTVKFEVKEEIWQNIKLQKTIEGNVLVTSLRR